MHAVQIPANVGYPNFPKTEGSPGHQTFTGNVTGKSGRVTHSPSV